MQHEDRQNETGGREQVHQGDHCETATLEPSMFPEVQPVDLPFVCKKGNPDEEGAEKERHSVDDVCTARSTGAGRVAADEDRV